MTLVSIARSRENLYAFCAVRGVVTLAAAAMLGYFWASWPHPYLLSSGLGAFALASPLLLYLIRRGSLTLAFTLGALGDSLFSVGAATAFGFAGASAGLAHTAYVVVAAAIVLSCFYMGPRWGPMIAVLWVVGHLFLDTLTGHTSVYHYFVDTVVFASIVAVAVVVSLLYHQSLQRNVTMAATLQQRVTEITALNSLLHRHLGQFNTVIEGLDEATITLEQILETGAIPKADQLRQARTTVQALKELAKMRPG